MLERLKGSNKIIGAKQTLKAIETDNAKVIFVARDADERVVQNVIELCRTNSIEIIYADNMKQLGKACGIEVGAATACILKGGV